MGHAAPISLGAGCFRLVPRRPGLESGLFGGVPGAACSAEATRWWLPVLADPSSVCNHETVEVAAMITDCWWHQNQCDRSHQYQMRLVGGGDLGFHEP